MFARFRRSASLAPLLVTQAFGLTCGLVGVRWSSSLVPPDVLGAYGVLLSTQLLATSVTHQGLIQHVQRFWTNATPARAYLPTLLAAARRPTLWLALALLPTSWFVSRAAGLAPSPGWWAWMFAINVATVAAHLLHAGLQAEQRYWAHFVASAAGSVTRTFLPLTLALTSGATLAVLGGGFLFHTVLWVGVAAMLLRGAWHRPALTPGETATPPADMVRTFIGVGLCGWLAAAAPRWFAALVLSPESTGFFMLAANLTAVVPAGISLVGLGYTFPSLFAAAREGANETTLLRSTDAAVLISLTLGQVLLFVLSGISPWLIGRLVDPRYTLSMTWLLAAGGGALAGVSTGYYSNLLVAKNRERACFQLALVSGLLRIIILAVLTFTGSVAAFRIGLSLLPWPTALLERWLVQRWLRSPDSMGSI